MSTTTSGANANIKKQKSLRVSWEDEEEEEELCGDFTELLFATMPQYCVECETFVTDPFIHFSNHESYQPQPTTRSKRPGVLHGKNADQAQREEDDARCGSEEACR